MAIAKGVLVMFMVMAALQVSMATIYKIGDSTGWTRTGNPDYKTWSSDKTFKVGDTIVFEYDPTIHNVMQVSHLEYRSCNVTAPRVIYNTGTDAITIKNQGHYYYICGAPGHCQSGQKVDIRVLPSFSSVGLAPAKSPFSTPIMAPAPAPSSADPLASVASFFSVLVMIVVLFNY